MRNRRGQPPLELQLSDLRRLVDERIKGKATTEKLARRAVQQITSIPLSHRITEYQIPRGFNLPNFSKYDGKADPIAHLKDFQQALILWEGDETLYCRMFASSLGRMALSWYHKLPSRSISSWEQLAEQFVGRFMISRAAPKSFDSLTSLRKRSSESLREYADRFVDLYNEVEDCTEKQALSVFRL